MKLKPFKFNDGLHLKRPLTYREAVHIITKIFGYTPILKLSDFNSEQRKRIKESTVYDVTHIIEGYWYISALDSLYVVEDFDPKQTDIFDGLRLIKYLQSKDLIY